jgi:hypothetical protein
MFIKGLAPASRSEPRWPVVLAILAVIILLVELPGRIRLVPAWVGYVVGVLMLVPIAAVGLASVKTHWLRIERMVTLFFSVIIVAATVANLANLVGAMVSRSGEIGGLQLLSSSIGVWVTNVLAFSLLYWQIDRGGPDARANNKSPRPDWLFPQEGAPPEDLPPDWRPTFVDYLFLGFNTATAFSPTDALPLTPRAKMMMMLESSISLATIVVVASRAINILGG